jgi:hypothetical protein
MRTIASPLLSLGLLLVLGPSRALGQDAPVPELPAAAEAGPDGARIWNIYSENGKVLRTLKPGEPCIVRERVPVDRGGKPGAWLKVEVPGGLPCFVHEEFVTETAEPGLLEVRGSRVNLRPIPSSGIDAYPVGQVARGIRLRLLEKLEKGWFRVLSPAGITAWADEGELRSFGPVDAARSRIEEAAAKVEEEWRAALAHGAEPAEPAPSGETTPSTSGEPQAQGSDPGQALRRADEGYRALQSAWDPEKAKAVRQDLEIALKAATEEDARQSIQARLDRLDLLDAIEKARIDAEELLARQRQLEKDAAESVLRKAEEIARANEAVLGGKDIRRQFDAYGWVVRTNAPPGRPVYRLDRGGLYLYEIESSNGRYDLAAYVGREVGVRGRVLQEPGMVPARFEVTRMEIISNTPAPGRR